MNNMKCSLCPNECNVNRTTHNGFCGTSDTLRIAKYYLHPFEEPLISGKNGSGTVFFCGCALKCVFCQNYELSRNERGKNITVEELANIFHELESLGAHNINLVNPTHYSNKIIDAFKIYKPKKEAQISDEDMEYVDDGVTVNEDDVSENEDVNADTYVDELTFDDEETETYEE